MLPNAEAPCRTHRSVTSASGHKQKRATDRPTPTIRRIRSSGRADGHCNDLACRLAPAPRDNETSSSAQPQKPPRRRQVQFTNTNLPSPYLLSSLNWPTAFPNPCRPPVTVPSLARARAWPPATATTQYHHTRSSCGVAQSRRGGALCSAERWRWRMPSCAAACGLLQIPPRPPRHATLTPPPKKAHPFPAAQIPTFPRSPSTRRRSVARTRAPRRLYLLPPLPGTRTLSRRCRWDCSSVGGPCGEEEEEQGAWRRGDCSRDELRRQQLPRARYALVRGFWFTPPAGWGIKVRW